MANFLNRRDLLKMGFTSTALLMLPDLSFGRNDEVIIGHHTHQYRVVKNWGVLDANKNPVNDCHEMVEDKKGNLYLITNETKNNILVYDKSGKLQNAWGSEFPGGHGLSIYEEGGEQFLLICDHDRHQVLKTDLKGKILLKIDYPKEIPAYKYPSLFKPTESCVNPLNGDIYVADGYGLSYVIRYDAKGNYISHFGGRGTNPENLNCSHGVIVDLRDQKPKLLVTSRDDMAWKIFTLEGQYLDQINLPGTFICRPVIKDKFLFGAAYRSTSQAYPNSGYLQILDEHNKVISTPGGSAPTYQEGKLVEQRKDDTGKIFMHPHDVLVDDDQNIYIPQWASQKTYPVKLERI